MTLAENELQIIKKNRLFSGLDNDALERTLEFFKASGEDYKKGTLLKRSGEMPGHFGLVIDGIVRIDTVSLDGRQMIMASVSSGGTFGESLAFLQRSAEIFITASSDVRILWLSTEKLRKATALTADEFGIAQRFIAILAERALSMNDRIQILSKATIRDKVLAFLSDCVRKTGKRHFTIDFDRAELAAYLGCDRSALSRELAKLRDEGIITYKKNEFTVKAYYPQN